VDYLSSLRAGFLDELEKIAGWSRKGAVPIHAQTVIDNHNKGKLHLRPHKREKDAKMVKSAEEVRRVPRREHLEGTIDIPMRMTRDFQPVTDLERALARYMAPEHQKHAQFYSPALPFSAGEPNIPMPLSAARRRRGDAPSKEDMDAIPKREDGKESATTIHSQSQSGSNIGVSLSPTGEHS
jgi:hypothetical protein